MQTSFQPRERTRSGRLSVAFILAPNFTLLAFSAFVDTLRLAADEGDRSQQVQCSWTILSHDMRPIRSSCGVHVLPTAEIDGAAQYDYVAVIGGILQGPRPDTALLDYLRFSAARQVPLIGICTGSFVLARLGLMDGRRSCVSWFHHADFEAEFPRLQANSDELYMVDEDRLTCAGGTSVVHLAAWLVEKHCGRALATKALRIMIEQARLPAVAPQPQPLAGPETGETRVRKAMLLIERNLGNPLSNAFIARHVNLGGRQLERLFKSALDESPSAYALRLRLTKAHELLLHGQEPIADIALQCGFVNNSHFARRFTIFFGEAPSAVRKQRNASVADRRPLDQTRPAQRAGTAPPDALC